MTRMKKGLAALAAACFLFAGMEKAQAVVGIPDDVPANTLLYPFFKVNPSRTAALAQDTLFVATNTDDQFQIVHFIIWSSASQHVYDFNVTLTPNDVFSCSLYDIILGPGCENHADIPNGDETVPPAPSAVRDRLLVNGQLRGYVTADAVLARTSLLPTTPGYPRDNDNILIGHEYIVDLPAGSATGLNAVGIEFVDNGTGLGQPAVPFPGTRTGFFVDSVVDNQNGVDVLVSPGDGLERIDGREGDIAQTGTGNTATWSHIIRYFTIQVTGLSVNTELWLWKDKNEANALANVAIYDEAENFHSITLDLPFEVNFRSVRDLITPGAPGGWFSIPISVDPDPVDDNPAPDVIEANTNVQSVAFSLQLANDGNERLRWDAIFPAHRAYTSYR